MNDKMWLESKAVIAKAMVDHFDGKLPVNLQRNRTIIEVCVCLSSII